MLAMISACAIGGEDTSNPTLESLLSGTASISLVGSSSRVSLTTDNEWSLSKTGSLSGNTVTWNITATKTATTSGHLVVQGTMTVTNTGNGPATIGNIVVNLQKRQGNSWVTKASDIANATQGDAATTANIHKAASSENIATFTENGASGSLNFMDATNNTVFSLVPQVMIGAAQTRTLLFSAQFDNNNAALNLTAGTQIRAEVIVTFGNATQSGNSTANLDINGNGTTDGDESRVRSVPSRLTLTVPAAVNGNGSVTLTDTAADIVPTGSVAITNNTFNLTATGGTITTIVTPGVDGGTVTNCAHLTTTGQSVTSGGFSFGVVNGLDLDACDTVEVPGTGTPPPCTPGSAGCAWKSGEMVTRTQSDWDELTNWSTVYSTIYSSTFGVVEVGIKGAGGFSMRFGSTVGIQDYLISSGTPAALTADVLNPTSTSSGVFGGGVLSLQLNVDFSQAGALGGSTNIAFGGLTLCAMTDASLNGRTVSNFLVLANSLLGGNTSTGYTISAVNAVVSELNSAFVLGAPSGWAQLHVFNGTCPTN